MGSLSNLYISQSYQSLIHLGTNNTASATLIGLEDGLGNSIGVSVNTAGNLYLSGTFSASLQEGYLYVGNASGRTIAFPTSSLVTNINTGSLVTTSSFNAYTASTNIRLSNIELTTASVLVSISNLNASSASQQISIDALNVFTASQSTASIVNSITELNQFTQSANIRLNNLESTSASVNTSITNINQYTQSNDLKWQDLGNKSGSWITESETGSFARYDVSNPWSADQTFTNITALSASFTYVKTVFETASVIYSSGSNQLGDELTDVQTLSGSVLVRGGLFVNDIDVTSSLNSINVFTQSANIRLNNLETTSASVNISISNLNTFTASISTASIVNSITNLNQFTQSANQRLGSLEAATSSYAISASVAAVDAAQQAQIDSLIAATSSYANSASFAASQLVQDNRLNNIEAKTGSYATTGSNTFTGYNQFQSGILVNTELDVAITSGRNFTVNNDGLEWDGSYQDKPAVFKSYVNITKDLNITGSLTASLQEGYVWVGNANGKTTTVSTASFIDTFVSGNLVTTSSFNAYTQSNDQRVSSLEAATSSYAISSSVAAVDAAQQAQINSLINVTGSYVTETESGSFLITASFASQTLTFTKGDGTTFGVLIPDVSGSTIDTGSFVTTSSFNAYTASNDQRVGSLESNSASVNISISNINLFTQSADQRLDSIEGQSGSWVTSAITASSIITASVSDDDITFTKGDGSTFTIQVATGSYALSSSYAETASLAINAKDIIVNVKNTTGAQINKGTVVRIIGATGDNALIGTASWTDDGQSANTLGFVIADIANDTFGTVMTQGTLLGINTDPALGYTAGQLIYLSSSGQYTNIKPDAPYHEVRLGQVLRVQQNNGSIYVLIQNGYELDELHDVDLNTGSLANNDLLAYNSASGQWTNKTLTQVGGVLTSSFNAYTQSTDNRLTNIESATASLNTSITNINSFTQSANQRLTAIETVSGSWITESESGSFLITGSVAGNVLTFTKGDNTTFNLTVATGSGGGGGSTDTGSLLLTASFNNSTRNITFTKGDASVFNLGGFATTGSNIFTDSQTIFANNAITISGSGGFGYGITLQGGQGIKIEGSGGPRLQFPNASWFNGNENDDMQFTADTDNPITRGLDFFLYGSGSRQMRFRNNSGGGATIQFSTESGSISFTAGQGISMTGSNLQLQGFTYPTTDGTNGQVLTTNGSKILSFTTISGGSTYANPTLNPYSGSLILAANTTTTSSFSHITASNNGQVNLMFQNRNLTGQIYITGSSNIFSNPAAPTAGRLNYLGGSSNILLTSFTANNTQAFPTMTGSTATIGGIYPAMNGNILMGQAAWTLNTSNNPGIHNYNNNILNGTTTFNMLGNIQTAGVANTGRFDFTGNTSAGTITINSPSRSLAEINAGATGSFRISMTNNNVQGTLTYNGPVSGSALGLHTITSNVLAGILTLNVQSQSRVFTVSQNAINGNVTYTDNTVFSPTLGSVANVANNSINGVLVMINRASASLGLSNSSIGGGAQQITNDTDASAITTAGQRQVNVTNTTIGGQGNNIYFTGSAAGAVARTVANSIIVGAANSASVIGSSDGAILGSTAIFGQGLNVIGTGINNASVNIGGDRVGSLFGGRWNAEDGNRNKSAETVFAIGTGTSGSAGIVRKTGLLIDSGSNTFIEGTLNVSGSSTFNGNGLLTGSLTVSGSATVTGSVNISNVIQLAQLDPLPAGATGQLAVSQSLLWFYDATQWKQVSLV